MQVQLKKNDHGPIYMLCKFEVNYQKSLQKKMWISVFDCK